MNCSRRFLAGDERCAYLVETSRSGITGAPFLGSGVVLVTAAVWLATALDQISTAAMIGIYLLAAVGLGSAVLGSYRQWGVQQSGHNPVTGQAWQRSILFGIELDWAWKSGIQLVAWAGSPARVIRYPASVAEFCRQGNAVDIISTALLQLFAQGILALGKQVSRRRFGRQRVHYLVHAGDAIGTEEPLGALESRIVEIVSTSTHHRLPIGNFLQLLLEGGQPQPRNFLVDRYVGPEIGSLGLGKVIGTRKRVLAPAPTTSARMGLDMQSVEQLYRDLWTTSPKEATDLLLQIDMHILQLMRTQETSDISSG